MLAEVQGVPENRKIYENIIKSLDMVSIGDDIQIVCDLELVSILRLVRGGGGDRPAASGHPPFCCIKYFENGA